MCLTACKVLASTQVWRISLRMVPQQAIGVADACSSTAMQLIKMLGSAEPKSASSHMQLTSADQTANVVSSTTSQAAHQKASGGAQHQTRQRSCQPPHHCSAFALALYGD